MEFEIIIYYSAPTDKELISALQQATYKHDRLSYYVKKRKKITGPSQLKSKMHANLILAQDHENDTTINTNKFSINPFPN